ncbi:MAG: autotransporter-associated beta strand repeat-containing protein [Thermoguttaceae bacterium]
MSSGLTAGGNAVSTISSTTLSWKVGGGTLTVAEGSQLDVSSRIHDYPESSEPLAKQGLGILALTGANTYTGGTSVDAGTLLANNATGSGTGSGAVTVNPGAALGGTGRIGGNVSIGAGGSLAPGDSPGTLRLGGNLTFDPNAFFDIDIDAVGLADLVQMEGGTLQPNDATIRVHLGFSPALGDSWTILQGEGIRDGMFNESVLVPNGGERLGWMQFDVSYGSSVILTVVPEPGAGLLLLAALACGMLVRRKR